MSRKPDRQIALVAFLQAQNCSTLPAAWRHPEARLDFMSADYYRDLARLLEHGKFDIGFFDDRLAMPDMFGKDHAHTVEHGIRCVKMDPIVTLMAMGMATERLGLGATCSTTYYDPFHVARLFSTLDLMSNGRAAWNVVTSVTENEALNMGRDGVTEHDLRYDRADEFMEVVHGHWDAWDDDALVLDQENNVFADPDKVHRLDHEGRSSSRAGPLRFRALPRAIRWSSRRASPGAAGASRPLGRAHLRGLSEPRSGETRLQGAQGRLRRPRARPGRHEDREPLLPDGRREPDGGGGQARALRHAAQRDRPALAALGGAQLRLRQEGHGRAVQRRGDGGPDRHAVHARPRRAGDRQSEPDRARLHDRHGPRPPQGPLGRRAEGGCGQDGGVLRRARLGRLRHRRGRTSTAPSRTSSRMWCPSCRSAASTGRTIPAPRSATISASIIPKRAAGGTEAGGPAGYARGRGAAGREEPAGMAEGGNASSSARAWSGSPARAASPWPGWR